MTPRFQRLSEIRDLMERRHIRPSKDLGQVFLVDRNLLQILVEAAELTEKDAVLEIGVGTGGLTAMTAPRVARVWGVEIDPQFLELAKEELRAHTNVAFIRADILRAKEKLNPKVVEAVREGLGDSTLKVVSNLPYQVATPIIVNLLESDLPVERLVVTVQKEIADKLAARPGRKSYGPLTLIVRARADVEILKVLSPSVFWPQPKVHSAFVRIVSTDRVLAGIRSPKTYRQVVQGLFHARRKKIINSLLAFPGIGDSRESLLGSLEEAGVDPDARAETLYLADVVALANALEEVRRSSG